MPMTPSRPPVPPLRTTEPEPCSVAKTPSVISTWRSTPTSPLSSAAHPPASRIHTSLEKFEAVGLLDSLGLLSCGCRSGSSRLNGARQPRGGDGATRHTLTSGSDRPSVLRVAPDHSPTPSLVCATGARPAARVEARLTHFGIGRNGLPPGRRAYLVDRSDGRVYEDFNSDTIVTLGRPASKP
eukprot:1176320-Prorocentrum_minimum.AAC.1